MHCRDSEAMVIGSLPWEHDDKQFDAEKSIAAVSISCPESSGSVVSSWLPGETGVMNFSLQNSCA